MSLATILRNRGIIVTEFEDRGKEFRHKWIEAFIETKDEEIPVHQFLWELLDWSYMDIIDRKEANKAFDKINKKYCYIFFHYSDDVLQIEFPLNLKARDLFYQVGDYSDVYVVDKGFNWTYLIPHEVDYGPYFYRK